VEVNVVRLLSSIIICLNLREFKKVIVRDHLYNLSDQIKIGHFSQIRTNNCK
jgi:hypothetical protein